MPIVSSGQLALSAIRDEFGAGTTSNVNLRTLSAAAGLSAPDGFNEFYGLSAFTPPQYVGGAQSISGSGTSSNPYIVRSFMNDTFEYTEEYAGCDWVGASELLYWYGRTNSSNRPEFRVTNLNPMIMKMQITTFSTNMCTQGASYAALYGAEAIFADPPYISRFSGAGDGTSARNLILNQVYTSGTLKGSVTLNQTFSIYSQNQHTWAIEIDGECDGYYEYSELYPCANPLSITNLTFKLWFEPV